MSDLPTTATPAAAAALATTSSLPTTDNYTQLHNDDEENTNPQESASLAVSSASSSSKKKSSSLRIRKSLSLLSKRKRRTVVFASGSKYQWLVALVILAPLLAILLSVILFDVHSEDEYKNSSTIWALGWCFMFLVVLYMAVLPRQVDVRSNGTVAIKTCLLTFFIDEIARAYPGGNVEANYDNLLRPRVMLATSLDKNGAVVIRRKNGKWDVVVTPEDPEGFVHAVEQMLRKKEDESDNTNNHHLVVTTLPESSSHNPNPASSSAAAGLQPV